MKKEDLTYLYLILFHVLIGGLGYLLPFTSKIYGYSIFVFWTIYIIAKQNRNNEVLLAAAYIAGSEVFLRMTGGNPLYEISKYGVIYFMLIGMYYSGFSRGAVPYWIFIVLLIPSVIISTIALNFDTNIRKAIAFNLSGPVCLALASIYTYKRKILLKDMSKILLSMGLPIVSCVVYLKFYTPNLQEVITGTESNFTTSGGFGPNQVATVLGLGMFIFFYRFMLESKTKFQIAVNLILALNITYRGMLTFSRGGMITGFVMIVILLTFLYFKSNQGGKLKMNFIIVFVALAMIGTWTYTSLQTGGLIDKRYSNQDAAGRVKKSQFTGREQIAENEINTFLKNPIFGVGVGKGSEEREAETGIKAASHNEITRLLAEHGMMGVVALLILFLTPVLIFLENKFNLFLLCFVFFWFLTINHAAMRIAAPAFVYALSLLNIQLSLPKSKEN
ncbi:O-Antigen ligase [Flavobacterium segetis]|uniref:O-Antigen ligase n=1 Tax=Flavobacterium segetis TaxID=271157 RepID=A0A1M5GS17_9FLAO|nr:O-antigen ligase family protein [Flavobacterium segetis]SHG06560.1 O-Antigen ligase [Flavobacterium segetis]